MRHQPMNMFIQITKFLFFILGFVDILGYPWYMVDRCDLKLEPGVIVMNKGLYISSDAYISAISTSSNEQIFDGYEYVPGDRIQVNLGVTVDQIVFKIFEVSGATISGDSFTGCEDTRSADSSVIVNLPSNPNMNDVVTIKAGYGWEQSNSMITNTITIRPRLPTSTPTPRPTKKPTLAPTTMTPTEDPTYRPSRVPTHNPTTTKPTNTPTQIPTHLPSTTTPSTTFPTFKPSTATPSTKTPSHAPTLVPTKAALPVVSVLSQVGYLSLK